MSQHARSCQSPQLTHNCPSDSIDTTVSVVIVKRKKWKVHRVAPDSGPVSKARWTGDPENSGAQFGVGHQAMRDTAAVHHGIVRAQGDDLPTQLKLR